MNINVRQDTGPLTVAGLGDAKSPHASGPLDLTVTKDGPGAVAAADSSSVPSGLQAMQALATTSPAKGANDPILTPLQGKQLVEEALNRAYVDATLGTPATANAYLDTTLKTISFYQEHFPDDPRLGQLNRLAVDIAAWMNWDPKAATMDQKVGMLAAAEYTRAHPKPDYYVTLEDPTLVEVFHKPVPFKGLDWLPTWLFNRLPDWFLKSFSDSALLGRPVRHPVDHQARAEDFIQRIKDAL